MDDAKTIACASCGRPLDPSGEGPSVCAFCERSLRPSAIQAQRRFRFAAKLTEGTPPRRTLWLWFYSIIRLPLGLLTTLSLLPSIDPDYRLIPVVFVALGAAVVIGLVRRQLWGWQLNWLLLFLEAVNMFNGVGSSVEARVIGLVAACFWLLPNAVYFSKRRHLFVRGRNPAIASSFPPA